MEFEVSLGRASRFELKGAIVVYSGGHIANGAFAAWHDAQCDSEQAPQLGPAKPLSTGFLRELSRGLGAMTKPEVLPENVLVRTPDTLIWWRPAHRCRMFFRHDDPLGAASGKVFPHPALVFKASRRELWIRAISGSKRPMATTPLSVAPYYNVNAEGLVCQGTMRSPGDASVASMAQWEKAFFDSEFTHIYGGGKLTRHPGGVVRLWTALASSRRFPAQHLAPARETLAQFAERER